MDPKIEDVWKVSTKSSDCRVTKCIGKMSKNMRKKTKFPK